MSLPQLESRNVVFFYSQSLIAQGSEFPLRKPPGFHYDFFLLGVTTFIAGLLGVPAPNGLIPQAPIHTRSLVVMRRVKGVRKAGEEDLEGGEGDRKGGVWESGEDGEVNSVMRMRNRGEKGSVKGGGKRGDGSGGESTQVSSFTNTKFIEDDCETYDKERNRKNIEGNVGGERDDNEDSKDGRVETELDDDDGNENKRSQLSNPRNNTDLGSELGYEEVPVSVVEQRVSNLSQGAMCLVLLTGPFLHILNLIPRGVLAGLLYVLSTLISCTRNLRATNHLTQQLVHGPRCSSI